MRSLRSLPTAYAAERALRGLRETGVMDAGYGATFAARRRRARDECPQQLPRQSRGHFRVEAGLEGGDRMRDLPGIRNGSKLEEHPLRFAELPLPTSAVTAHAGELCS